MGEFQDFFNRMQSSEIPLSDEEGRRIASALNVNYKGFKADFNTYWFEPKEYEQSSSYMGGNNIETAISKTDSKLQQFGNPPMTPEEKEAIRQRYLQSK